MSGLVLLILCLPVHFIPAAPVIVEIEDLPGGYSLDYGAYEPILKALPELKPRIYRRLRFPIKGDELSFALKTGNAPDIISLTWADYRRLAEDGEILDLSEILLREADTSVSGFNDAAWTPLRNAGDRLLRHMLVDGRLYGFPARKEVHGLIVRRDLLRPGDPVDSLTAPAAAKLAGMLAQRMNSTDRGRGIVLPFDTDLFLNWSIADYGVSVKASGIDPDNDSAIRGAALAALQGVYGSFRSMLHDSVYYCLDCNAASQTQDPAVQPGRKCQTCLSAAGRAAQVHPPVGMRVQNVQEGLELFRSGRTAAVVCTRSRVIDLVESGMMPDKIRFIPLAGAGYAPDVQILALYKGVPQRDGGVERKQLLLEYLKMYSSQFLAGKDSPLFLWYERNTVSLMVKEGYRSLYSDAEIKVCTEIAEACAAGAPGGVNDSMVQFDNIISMEEFVRAAGVEISTDLEPVARSIFSENVSDGGFAGELQMVRRLRLTEPAAVSWLIVLLAGLLAAGMALFMNNQRNSAFIACAGAFPRWSVLCLGLIGLVIILRFVFPVLLTSVSVASVILDGPGTGVIVQDLIEHTGWTVLDILVSVIFGCLLAVVVAGLVSGAGRWSVSAGLLISIPLAMAGFWGDLLIDAVLQWFGEIKGRESLMLYPVVLSAIRAIPASWALLPFFVPGYVYLLRKKDPLMADLCGMDGGNAVDRFFMVTIPSLEPVLKLHALVLACLAVISAFPSVMREAESSYGGFLLRAVLFGRGEAAGLTAGAAVIATVTGLVCLGRHWLAGIKVRPVYRKDNS